MTGGIWKVVTAPFQLPIAVLQTSVQKNIFYGATFGVLKGVGTSVAHVVGGTVQVISNAIPANPLELVTRKLAYIQAGK
ncbi:MAG TPA: hypothetical protein VNE39_09015 [Planctomycetota bacterium]|nr:hypothetical protein [Planctomycetota bacterium]